MPFPSAGYIKLYPTNIYMIDAIEYNAIFLVKISTVLFERTKPASNIEKPAAIHITNAPITKK